MFLFDVSVKSSIAEISFSTRALKLTGIKFLLIF